MCSILDDDDLTRVAQICASHGVKVACIGSPIGKSPIAEPIDFEADNLRRIFRVGEVVGCRNVRLFSFYPPDTSTNERYDEYVATANRAAADADGYGSSGGVHAASGEREGDRDRYARAL